MHFHQDFWEIHFRKSSICLSDAPESFQKHMIDFIWGINGRLAYIDDITIYGETLDLHNKRLIKVLKRVRPQNVRFKLEIHQLDNMKLIFLVPNNR